MTDNDQLASPSAPAAPPSAYGLRQQAEAHLQATRWPFDSATPTLVETSRLLHELQVHQIELELQNEDLQISRQVAEDAAARYADLYDFAPLGYLTLNRVGDITQANLAAAQLLGYERARLLGRRLGTWLAEDATPTFNTFLWQSFVTGAQPGCELALNVKGQTILVQMNASVSDDGMTCRVVLVDITARKAAQTDEQLLRMMMERTERVGHIGSWEWDAQADAVTWSHETFRFFGRDPALGVPDLAGQGQLYTPDDAQRLFKAVSKAMEDGQPYDIDVCGVRPNGEQRYCHILGYPERDATGKVVRLVGSLQDISERKAAEDALQHSRLALQASHNLLVKLSHNVPGTIYQYQLFPDGHACFPFASEGIWNVYEVTPQQVRDSADVVAFSRLHPDDLDAIAAAIDESARTLQVWRQEYRVNLPQQGLRWLSGLAQPERLADGSTLWHGFITDITERKAAQAQTQLDASVFTHAREGIMITDASGAIVKVNAMFTSITGFSREDVLGQNPRILNSGCQLPGFYAAMWNAIHNDGAWSGEIWNRHKSGKLYAVLQTISAVRDAAGTAQHYVALFTDITLMKQHQQQLEHIAHYDSLTNLPNRVLLADRLHQAIVQSQRRGKVLAVVYLDLDGFKQINDRHGHGVGDDTLVLLSQHLKEALREGDTLARIGGDEFVAILVDLESAADCVPVLARLLQAAAEPVTVGDALLQVSASIGVTLYPQVGVQPVLLLRHADQAMYIAKDAGKNRYHFFDVASAAAVQTQRESLQDIAHALQQRQFVLYYQPKVNMQTGAVVGAEALIRWQHPLRGLLAPGVFLPVIENHALSIEVGEWVIDTALNQISTWRALGLNLPVSVNVSAHQLQQNNFVARLTQALAAHPDIHPELLELEILETSTLNDMAQVSAVMHACLGLGVSFALDDFGTGYSSLSYLKHLPAALLKIDQSFVRDMLTDSDDLAIVQSVIGLTNAFQRNVIAEGVETAAHGERLLTLGCELAQGYGVARPMPAADLPQWVQRWQTQPVWTA